MKHEWKILSSTSFTTTHYMIMPTGILVRYGNKEAYGEGSMVFVPIDAVTLNKWRDDNEDN